MHQNIAEIVVPLPVAGPFDYLIKDEMRGRVMVGQRVYVPFGHRYVIGFVIGLKARGTPRKLKPVHSLLDLEPTFNDPALSLAKEFAKLYGCQLGEALDASLPAALRKKTITQRPLQNIQVERGGEKCRSTLCQSFLDQEGRGWIVERMALIRKAGQGVLVLVPETARIQGMKTFLEKEFKEEILLLDRRSTAKKELEAWSRIKDGRNNFVIGTRSAVFAPVRDLGLIVMMDEEHRAYKQEQSPFYHARDIAQMRARLEQTELVFFTPAPSSEIMYQVRNKTCERVVFPPSFQADMRTIDLSNYKPNRKTIISFPLQNYIHEILQNKGRVLLYLNRRGFSLATRCHQCGHAMRCQRCDVVLSYLFSKKKLICSLCGWSTALPERCPQCQSKYLRSWGIGDEKVESECARIFPAAKVLRVDRDMSQLSRGADIVVATQAVWRTLDEKMFDLIAVLDFDAEIHRPDFRSEQQAFALLLRLRKCARQRLVVQTYHPDHKALQAVSKDKDELFYKQELKQRQESGLPPYKHLIEITFRGPREDAVQAQIFSLYEELQKVNKQNVEIMEPQPDFHPKLRDQYRFIIMLKSSSVKKGHALIQQAQKSLRRRKDLIMTVQVDP